MAAFAKFLADRGAALNAQHGRPAAAVNVMRVVNADMPVTVSAIGTVTPSDTATVKPQVSGNIVSIDFREGQMVHAGQVIARIDDRPFKYSAEQASATLARDTAALASARLDLQRYATLAKQDSIARQQYDQQAALVRQDENTVAADRAAAKNAGLTYNFASIKAPISGQIGLKQVTVGNYVTPADANGVAVVTAIDPIDVTFAVPQNQLAAIHHTDGAGIGIDVAALDQDNTTIIAHGRLLTFDNQINTATGTVNAKARFANPGSVASAALFPNQFVNVRLLVSTLHAVPVVPVAAVRHGPPGDFVFVVQPDNTVRLTVVKTGPSDGTNIAILGGLAAGQTVVTEGADGLDNGSKVRLPGGGAADKSGGAGGGGHHHHGG